jgi:hypothetical protein
VTLKPIKNWTIEPYYILLSDARASNPNSAGTGPTATAISTAQFTSQTRNFLGGRINGKAGSGIVMDFTYEGNYQFGSAMDHCTRNAGLASACAGVQGVTSAATTITGGRNAHISASQHAVKTGFTFAAVPMKPRIGYEFNYASGDKCSNGPQSGDSGGCSGRTRIGLADNLFPTNHFHYGYMDMMSWKNMVNHQIMFDVKPSPVSKLQFNYIVHRLASTADNWYRANQAAYAVSRSTNQEASLGQELNVHYWHTLKEKFKFEIGYGHFFAGKYLENSADSLLNNHSGAATLNGTAIAVGTRSTLVDQNWGYVMGSILF